MTNKLVAFFKKCEELNLPMDICAYAYMELRSSSVTPDRFYQFFDNVYSQDTIFEYLQKMVDNHLLLYFDDSFGFDDTSFLTLNVAYDQRITLVEVE
ncbi:hypothetical protein A1D22_09255 [Pasteurellaceae bacterium LFhippo2]|nr:hypothetical protein [Pasteurellaceae bacterium LFhippo2]